MRTLVEAGANVGRSEHAGNGLTLLHIVVGYDRTVGRGRAGAHGDALRHGAGHLGARVWALRGQGGRGLLGARRRLAHVAVRCGGVRPHGET